MVRTALPLHYVQLRKSQALLLVVPAKIGIDELTPAGSSAVEYEAREEISMRYQIWAWAICTTLVLPTAAQAQYGPAETQPAPYGQSAESQSPYGGQPQ